MHLIGIYMTTTDKSLSGPCPIEHLANALLQ